MRGPLPSNGDTFPRPRTRHDAVAPWIAAGVAFLVGYAVHVAALWYAWEEPLASEPAGVYQHSHGRPMLGRKLKGKSKRELRDLGLLVEHGDGEAQVPTGAATQ